MHVILLYYRYGLYSYGPLPRPPRHQTSRNMHAPPRIPNTTLPVNRNRNYVGHNYI